MSGFFSSNQLTSANRPDGRAVSCAACGLYKNVRSPRMAPFGNFKKGILNIGEAPGETEDQTGKPWQGKAGQLLQQTYKQYGIDLFEDCLNINACHCRPTDDQGKNRAPTTQEVENCRRTTLQIIAQYKPKLIMLLGNAAVNSLIGHRWRDSLVGINKWRGWTIPDQDFNAWVCPTYHPSFIERSAEDGQHVANVIWGLDLAQAFSQLGKPVPKYKEPVIETLTDLSPLNKIQFGHIAFDYETTGLKPHGAGQRIISCSVADTADHVYVFMMPETRAERRPWLELLARPTVAKMAHNMKFEHNWSCVRLNQPVENWLWDCMIAAHILDNRQSITGLKFQTYVNLGVVDYASDVSGYLEGDKKNGNSINTIQKLIATPQGAARLLKYNALDSINEFRLADIQMELIEPLPF